MEPRNSMMLESSGDNSMLIATVKSMVTRNGDRNESETEEDFFLMSQVANADRYVGEESVKEEEAAHKQQTTLDTVEFADLCRICANASDHMIPIFEGEGAEHELRDKILKYLPIHVSESDTLPLQLCYHCASTLLAWHELSEGCLDAERRLLEIQHMLQNKHQYYNLASLDNLEMPAPITTTTTTTTTSTTVTTMVNSINSQPDCELQVDVKNDVQGVEEIDKSNRCDRPGKFFAVYRKSCVKSCARRQNSVKIKHDVAGNVTASAGNTRETSERETQGSSDDVRHDEMQTREETQATSISPDKPAVKTYSCDSCQRIFKRKYYLLRHVATCKLNEKDPSNARVKATSSKKTNNNLAKGQDAQIDDDETDDEDQPTKSPTDMFRSRKKKIYPCAYCEHVADKRKLLYAHIVEVHPELAKTNLKSFVATETVQRARMEHDGKVYYHCAECGKTLNSPYTFYWHIRIHTGERMFTCHLCGKRFRVNQGLVRHLRETHYGIKNVACDVCGRMFSTRRNVEDHRRTHTGERPYVCNVCGKTFRQKASLFVHNRTHTDVFPYKCNYCDQAFRTRPPLALHLTKHTGEKPHACDLCDRRFRIKYEMKRHRLIHFDEKPWHCTDCNLSFRQKRYLVNHTRLNHESPRSSAAESLRNNQPGWLSFQMDAASVERREVGGNLRN